MVTRTSSAISDVSSSSSQSTSWSTNSPSSRVVVHIGNCDESLHQVFALSNGEVARI